ncbi:hypothetical protein HPB50_022835 [Hyalomma asiaticum]|uniref:Uncharacterized protein n=1 Tax=Hyalomma asiaticum TaxID=266040 RepID=A0ACB7T4V3_HYAAI|nr:hypothetical protein HPB50_022835 [Hyalomma asiaticum]
MAESMKKKRASALYRLRSPHVMRGLTSLSSLELQQLADSVVGLSPMRQVARWDLVPLYVPHRMHELLLDRLLIAHHDLRALLGAVEPSVLTRLRVTKIRCTCQAERNSGSVPDEDCATQNYQDVERLARLLEEAKSLQELETDMPVDVNRLVASGPYEGLKSVRLARMVSTGDTARSSIDRYFLSRSELTSLLQQMPALRELRCDASQAIGSLEEGELALLARLEVVHLLHEVPEAKALRDDPFAPSAQFLVAHCPNVRELVFRAAGPRDLRPLCALRHLERLCLCYGGRGGRAFLDESLFDALGHAATNLRHLELPTEAHFRSQALADACPALESLVARCFLRRSTQTLSDDRRLRQPPSYAVSGTARRSLSSLAEIELITLRDAAALMPLCPALRTITLTLPHMDPVDAQELADLCERERCPKLERITLNLMGSYSHRTVVHFLERVARVPQVRRIHTNALDSPYFHFILSLTGMLNREISAYDGSQSSFKTTLEEARAPITG